MACRPHPLLHRLPRAARPTCQHLDVLPGKGRESAIVDTRRNDDLHELTFNDGAGRCFVEGHEGTMLRKRW